MLVDLFENRLIDGLTDFALRFEDIGEVEHCVDKLAVGAYPLSISNFWDSFFLL